MRKLVLPGMVLFSAVAGFSQDSNFAAGPQYLMNYGSPLFARSLATPSLSLSGPPLEVGARLATAGLNAGEKNDSAVPTSSETSPMQPAADLFSIFYGTPAAHVIEITSRGRSYSGRELPASILETGVWQWTTPQALRERGYGVTLAEAASRIKSQPASHAARTYTNADVDLLHSGSQKSN